MPKSCDFALPDDVVDRLSSTEKANLLSHVRSLPWYFLNSTVTSSEFDFQSFAKLLLDALPEEYDLMFDDITDDTSSE